jgi:hypothetical protein
MIRLGTSVRLTAAERKHLRMLTGEEPGRIETAEQLNRLIERKKLEAGDGTPEGRLIGLLLEDYRAF